MKKLSTSEIISIVSIVVSIIIVVLEEKTDEVTKWIIFGLLFAALIVYSTLVVVRHLKIKRGISSTILIGKTKKYTMKIVRLAQASEKQLKRFAFLKGLRGVERHNKLLLKKCRGDLKTLVRSEKYAKDVANLHDRINEYFRQKSANYADLEAVRAYSYSTLKAMESAPAEKAYQIAQAIIEEIFSINRVLLQLEQHHIRIRLGKYVARYTNSEIQQIKAYTDLIGWTYILLGDNRRGHEAISTAINIINNRIGSSGEIPDGMTADKYYEYLFLKVRALRHLGTTYYTYKNIDSYSYLESAMEILDKYDFEHNYKDKAALENMRFGILNNMYLSMFYKFVEKDDRDKRGLEDIKNMLIDVERNIAELDKLPPEKQDKHRFVKLTALKCQLTKALDVCGLRRIDVCAVEKDMERVESILNKNIYFDDAIEVYINQKVQLLYEKVNLILQDTPQPESFI